MNFVYQQILQEKLKQLETLLSHNQRQQVTKAQTDTHTRTHPHSHVTRDREREIHTNKAVIIQVRVCACVEGVTVSAVWAIQRSIQRRARLLVIPQAGPLIHGSLLEAVLQRQSHRPGEVFT